MEKILKDLPGYHPKQLPKQPKKEEPKKVKEEPKKVFGNNGNN